MNNALSDRVGSKRLKTGVRSLVVFSTALELTSGTNPQGCGIADNVTLELTSGTNPQGCGIADNVTLELTSGTNPQGYGIADNVTLELTSGAIGKVLRA